SRQSGPTSFKTWSASSNSPSNKTTSTSYYDRKQQAAQAPYSKPSVSPCRRCSDSWRRLPSCRRRDLWPQNAAGGRGVVPRQSDFSRFTLLLKYLLIHGVQLESNIFRLIPRSSIAVLCSAMPTSGAKYSHMLQILLALLCSSLVAGLILDRD